MKLDRNEIQANLLAIGHKIGRYKVIVGLVLVLGTYGFLLWRIDSLNNVQPSADAVTAAQPNPLSSARIDKQVINQLESLRNNNVNVRTLFDQARSNPFQ